MDEYQVSFEEISNKTLDSQSEQQKLKRYLV